MSLNRGKRRRRERRGGDGPSEPREPRESEPAPKEPAPTGKRNVRRPKSMAERSPIMPAIFTVLCLGGSIFTVTAYGARGFNLFVSVFYLLLAAVEGYITFRIYRARGGTWR